MAGRGEGLWRRSLARYTRVTIGSETARCVMGQMDWLQGKQALIGGTNGMVLATAKMLLDRGARADNGSLEGLSGIGAKRDWQVHHCGPKRRAVVDEQGKDGISARLLMLLEVFLIEKDWFVPALTFEGP